MVHTLDPHIDVSKYYRFKLKVNGDEGTTIYFLFNLVTHLLILDYGCLFVIHQKMLFPQTAEASFYLHYLRMHFCIGRHCSLPFLVLYN